MQSSSPVYQPNLPSPEPQPPLSPPDRGRRDPARSRFWLGFALGFALLALASCGSAAVMLGLNRISLADITGNGVVWEPPPLAPTPAPNTVDPSAGAVVAVPGGLFAPGESVRNLTNSRVNIRSTPGYLGKGAEDVLGLLQPGDAMEILGDSADFDNLRWWRIRFAAPGGNLVDGWVAEATASGVQILGR